MLFIKLRYKNTSAAFADQGGQTTTGICGHLLAVSAMQGTARTWCCCLPAGHRQKVSETARCVGERAYWALTLLQILSATQVNVSGCFHAHNKVQITASDSFSRVEVKYSRTVHHTFSDETIFVCFPTTMSHPASFIACDFPSLWYYKPFRKLYIHKNWNGKSFVLINLQQLKESFQFIPFS